MARGELADATIVFDLDGTLVDTAPDLLRALNDTLDIEGLAHPKMAEMRPLIGHGARVLVERASALKGVSFTSERLDQLTAAFIDFYKRDIAARSRPFPGVVDTLTKLKEAGALLCVCTNKRSELSVQLLEALGLASHFAAIIGADSVAHRKPHPDHYRQTVLRAGGMVMHSVMIGDSASDVGAAKAASAPVAIARFGYSDVPVERLGADVLFSHFNEVPRIVRALLHR